MKTLKFHFCHPVKGMVRLVCLSAPNQSRVMRLSTHYGETAQIPIENLPEGKWKATLSWTNDGRDYFYQKEFEVKSLR
ncbi:hypothetical protein MUY27_07600 [Mucilaginibacter sp. RS28]|uniref:Uncharacterized protein n=1 Tax=Mucilaginibacter straminoryzae TaxID=2932774 RepID=A0A9X1X6H7_9SPHI|nr:hypothetical protein [Mucilaginibacter straminoryzae]MCJ8209569.1 hypothetical protein [Mucilaginibacter straminoryzae]